MKKSILAVLVLILQQVTFSFDPAIAATARGAEADLERAVYGFDLPPFKILGAGRPQTATAGSSTPTNAATNASSNEINPTVIDKPDGLAFTSDGKLLVIETKNKRVGIYSADRFELLGYLGAGVLNQGDTSDEKNATAFVSPFSLEGEIVGVSVSPMSGEIFVADEDANEVHVFGPQFLWNRKILAGEGFKKLGGITVDSHGRLYAVDAMLKEVRRYFPNGKRDTTFVFTAKRADGTPYLDLCEGVAVDEKRSQLYVSSELDSAIQVFDLETGIYLGKTLGANLKVRDGYVLPEDSLAGVAPPSPEDYAKPSGKAVFYKSVEGLTLVEERFLLGVDEDPGHIQIFDLNFPDVWNRDLISFRNAELATGKREGYKGYFGKTAPYDFDGDKTLKAKAKRGEIIPGQVNPPGSFCSPDGIASYSNGQFTFIAVADQCNYRIAIYRLPKGSLAR